MIRRERGAELVFLFLSARIKLMVAESSSASRKNKDQSARENRYI
jgi:hypothetical protein